MASLKFAKATSSFSKTPLDENVILMPAEPGQKISNVCKDTPTPDSSDSDPEYISELFQCPPVAFRLPAEDVARLDPSISLAELRLMCFRKFSLEMLGAEFTSEQRQEIAMKFAKMSPGKCGVRRFMNSEQMGYYTKSLQSILSKTPIRENISNKPFLTFCITFPTYQHDLAVPGQVVAIFYTNSPCKKVEDEATRLMREEIRREMEAKAREEQTAREAERQLEELQEKIKTHFKIVMDKSIEACPALQALLQQLIIGGHNVLVVKIWNWFPHSADNNALIITNKAIYILCYVLNKEKFTNRLSPIYSFNYPLNLKQTRLIANMLSVDIQLSPIIVVYQHMLYKSKEFESIIRYIPGSYINGPWKQLDGFFGYYINESTMDLTQYPPPM